MVRDTGGQLALVVATIHDPRGGQLLEVVQAHAFLRFSLGGRERRQEQRGQNANDGDHHQQFDQREATLLSCYVLPRVHSRLRPSKNGQQSVMAETYSMLETTFFG